MNIRYFILSKILINLNNKQDPRSRRKYRSKGGEKSEVKGKWRAKTKPDEWTKTKK